MKVLGNDPFKRGAATPATPEKTDVERLAEKAKQPDVERLAEKIAAEPPPSAPKPAPAVKPVPPKPVITPLKAPEPKKAVAKPGPPPPVPKMVMPKPKVGEGSPAKRAVTSFVSAPPPPKLTAPERPSLKSAAVEKKTDPALPAVEKQSIPDPDITAPSPPRTRPRVVPAAYSPSPSERPPEAHAHSPGFGPDPIAHSESPVLKHVPEAHDGSPGVVESLGALRAQVEVARLGPVNPDDAPAAPRAAPEPHPGSPELRAEFTPHETSPELRAEFTPHETSPELRAEFTPHETSPDMVAELPDDATATPHAGSPAVVRELRDAEAVPHGGSPEVMADRVSALDAPEDGLTRPFFEAATGLMNAAKSALGFGATGNVDTWGKDEGLTRSLQPVADFLYDKYFRVTVEGAELIPRGPSIIVANHSGALPLDGPMLHLALQRERSDLQPARWLVEDQVFHAPVLGVLINRLGAVRAHPENAVRLLEEGRPVIVFPEGFLGISKPFTQRYQLKRFGRGGYVKLALKHDVPIVPVAIVGAEESMPLLAKIPAGALGLPYLPLTPPPLPARWRIRFSEPIDVEGSTEDLAYVQEQNDRVRDTIAGMLTSMLGS